MPEEWLHLVLEAPILVPHYDLRLAISRNEPILEPTQTDNCKYSCLKIIMIVL